MFNVSLKWENGKSGKKNSKVEKLFENANF